MRTLGLLGFFALAGWWGCGEGGGPAVEALHQLPLSKADDFYALPFPSDLRLLPDGSMDLTGYRRPAVLSGSYVAAMEGRVSGAGLAAAVILRFSAPLDPATLPSPSDDSGGAEEAAAALSLRPEARVFLVNLQEGSPEYGQRHPVLVRFHPEGGRFIGPNWLSVRPFPGVPLRERTRYAALVTAGVRGAEGGPLVAPPLLARLLQDRTPTADEERQLPGVGAAWPRYDVLRRYLQQRGDADAPVAATVFTTQDATSLMGRLRAAVHEAPAPAPLGLTYLRDHDGLCHLYQGTFRSPNFQQGTPPYVDQGGDILDSGGGPRPVREEELRFALSIPNAPMPQEGWPVILYAHGTGGDYQTFIREGVDLRAAYAELEGATARMAVISIDQVLHGPRDPSHLSPEITFFNLRNIRAARDNTLQGAADDFQLLRLVQAFAVDGAPGTGRPIRFDKRRVYFMGHSQGGLTGPLFVAAEPTVRAAVFSGAGAGLVTSLLNKTEPTDIHALVEGLLDEPATPDHPFLNLLQAFFERADPGSYGRLFFREPPPGFAAKSVFQTQGLIDHYTPVPNISAFALSMGVQPVAPRLLELPGLTLPGQRGWTQGPVRGNSAGGAATAVLRQYPQKDRRDGHFVAFDLWAARNDWSRFLASDVVEGLARLP